MSSESENGYLVGSLHHAVRGGAWGLENMPRLIREAIENKIWTGWTDRATGKTFSQPDFYTFITTPVLEGLGGKVHHIIALCSTDAETLRLIYSELEQPFSPVQFTLREIRKRLSLDEIQELVGLLKNEASGQRIEEWPHRRNPEQNCMDWGIGGSHQQ